ncbi:MAG TPA: hypothetical protein VHE30_18760 [Polyangiaceae bacterium]|nr:hypothetical protein [Polyangiaceae bacterium]
MSALTAAALFAQVVVLAPSGYVGTFGVGDRTEVRARSVLDGPPAFDVETAPYATLSLNGRRSTVTLSYTPRFSLFDVTVDRQFAVSNAARLAFGWSATERLRLQLAASGAVGSDLAAQSFRSPSTVGAPVVAPPATGAPNSPSPTGAPVVAPTFAPAAPVIDVLSYRADAGASYAFSRRTHGDVLAGYGGGRGLDAPSRAVVGEYYGPSGFGGVTHSVTRQDALATRVRASYTYSSVFGSDYLEVTPSETWSHSFSLRTSGLLGAGASYLRTHPTRTSPLATGVYPYAEGALQHVIPLSLEDRLTFRAATRLSVQYDPVLNAASPQASGVLASTWGSARYGVIATVEAVTTLPTDTIPETARQIAGGITLFHAPSRVVRFELGARGYVQDVPSGAIGGVGSAFAPGATTPQWLTFAALVLAAPPVAL